MLKRKVLHRSEGHGNTKPPKNWGGLGPKYAGLSQSKTQTDTAAPYLSPCLAAVSCWVVSLGKGLPSFLDQALELKHAQPLWKGDGKGKEGCYHTLGVPQVSSTPLGLHDSGPLQTCSSTKGQPLMPAPLPRAPPPPLAQSRSFYPNSIPQS